MAMLFITNVLLVLSVAHLAISKDLEDDIIVQLKDGKIRGHILKSENGNDYYAFHEIPYAAPPVRENRFQLPKKVVPWNGVLNNTKNTRVCFQLYPIDDDLENSEDCLFVNVYTPVKPGNTSERLPVVVWIHGGAFSKGSGAYQYFGPKYIIDHGIVVVTVNYRLGPLGFGTTEDDIIPGNLGLRDQQLALEWVNENIHVFAGNSHKVTLAGQSAGAMSVGYHLLGQKNGRNLFQAAILQSGTPLGGIVQNDAKQRLFDCGRFLDRNFSSNASSDLLRVLQQASVMDILLYCDKATGTVLEKKGDFSYPPLYSLMEGKFREIPTMIGFTSEEFITAAIEPNVSTLVSLDNNPEKLIPHLIKMSMENRTIAGKLLKKVYTKTSFEKDIGAYCRWNSDTKMTTPICKHAELAPVYLYQFSYYGQLGQRPADIIPGAERVAHGADYHYIWDNGINSDLSKFSEEDRLTLHRFVKIWTNFVKYQHPTPDRDPLLENITWPITDSETLTYLNINNTLELKQYPRQYTEVKNILDYYMEPPYIYY